MSFVSTDYREASEKLSHQGIEVSRTTLHQSVCKWSETLNVCDQVETQKLAENQRWYVSCDGCYTNSPDGWKEVKVRCIYKDYPQPVSGGTPSVRTKSGIYQEDIDTQEIVFIADAAAWIWNLCPTYFPNKIF